MILRRISGLTVSLLLLQLNFASGDLVCAKHEVAATQPHSSALGWQTPASVTDHDHGQGSGNAEGNHAQSDAEKPCEIPAQRDCCQALASCSMTLGPSVSNSATRLDVADVAIAPSAVEAPAYLIRPPEPPPPKA